MRNILFCIILYTFTSNLYSYAVEFELSDVIKQARQAEIMKNHQQYTTEQNARKSDKTEQNAVEKIKTDEPASLSSADKQALKKEQ